MSNQQLCSDIIVEISKYLDNLNFLVLNKNINKQIKEYLSQIYWKNKYDEYLISHNLESIKLNGDQYLWKYEYDRIRNNIFFFDYYNSEVKFRLSIPRRQFNKTMKIIPKEIGALINIKYLIITGNKFKIIPVEMENLINLKCIDLSNNKIEKIPNNLFIKLINLNDLNLSNNKIKYIPESIGNLENLITLDVSKNQISNLPKNIINCKNLKYLNIANNLLKEYPQQLYYLDNLNDLIIYNNKFTTFSKITNILYLTYKKPRIYIKNMQYTILIFLSKLIGIKDK